MKWLSLPQVEDRVRAALHARSGDCAGVEAGEPGESPAWLSALVDGDGPDRPPAPVRPLTPRPAWPSPARRPRRRLVVAGVAVVSVVALGVVARLAGSSPEADGRPGDVRSGPAPPADREPLPDCGHELPVRVTVSHAQELVDGPAPGGQPAEPGQVVWHWTRSDAIVEARWPGRPQPHYAADVDGAADSDGGRDGDGRAGDDAATDDDMADGDGADQAADEAPGIVMSERPPRIELNIGYFGQLHVQSTTIERLPTPGVPEGCELIELKVIPRRQFDAPLPGISGLGRVGLQLTDPDTDDISEEYTLVDLNPLVVDRRPVGILTPDSVRPCDEPAGGGRSGGADPTVRGDSAPAVLQAFAATTDLWRMGLTPSGWVELDEPDGTVSYGQVHDESGWGMLVEVVPDEDGTGWHLGGWRRSPC